MANIKYEITRWDVQVCNDSHATAAGCVDSVVLGVTATDQETGISAYKDERISVSHTPLAEFEQQQKVEEFVEGILGGRGWYLELQTRIASQIGAPKEAPSDRDRPDFTTMTIGDGYADLPNEETTEESGAASDEETTSESGETNNEESSAEEESGEESGE